MEGEARYERWRHDAGVQPQKRERRYVELDKTLERLVSKYNDYKETRGILKYLSAVGFAVAPTASFVDIDYPTGKDDDSPPEPKEEVSDTEETKTPTGEDDESPPKPNPEEEQEVSDTEEAKPLPTLERKKPGSTYIFRPPPIAWQRQMCNNMNLQFSQKSSLRKTGKRFTGWTPPKSTKSITPDGNCLFRALSFWVTGREHEHMAMRQAICDYLDEEGEDVRQMRIAKTWGTDKEILAATSVLEGNILVWTTWPSQGLKWVEFPIGKKHKFTIYLDHSMGNHFDVASSV
jgi:hypothetical protein